MSDDRLFHKRAGHSTKVNLLSPLEEIVWRTYINEADDFGVMRFRGLEIKRAHDRFENTPTQKVQQMLERVKQVGLIQTFEHQHQVYCYYVEWQDYQKQRYALKTDHPRIPAEHLKQCSLATQWLHTIWPGGNRKNKLASWQPPTTFVPPAWTDRSGNVPLLACAGAVRARSVPPHVPPRTVPRDELDGTANDHPNCHPPCERICLSQKQHRLFLKRFGEVPDAEEQLELFYAQTRSALPAGPFGDKPWEFWQERFEQRFGVQARGRRVTTLYVPDADETSEMLAKLREDRANLPDPETRKRLLQEARSRVWPPKS